MRKITMTMKGAFEAREKFSLKNAMCDGNAVYLHGHKIFWRDGDDLMFSMCGWPTVTTRDRINALMPDDFYIRQQGGDQWLGWKHICLTEIDPDETYSIAECRKLITVELLLDIQHGTNMSGKL